MSWSDRITGFLRMMAAGTGISQSELTTVTTSLHWFLKPDRPEKFVNDPMVVSQDRKVIAGVAGVYCVEGEGRSDLDAHGRYDHDQTNVS